MGKATGAIPIIVLETIPRLLKAEQAAQILQVSVETLATWRSSPNSPGRALRFVAWGRSVRYREDDILKFVQSRAPGQKFPPARVENGKGQLQKAKTAKKIA